MRLCCKKSYFEKEHTFPSRGRAHWHLQMRRCKVVVQFTFFPLDSGPSVPWISILCTDLFIVMHSNKLLGSNFFLSAKRFHKNVLVKSQMIVWQQASFCAASAPLTWIPVSVARFNKPVRPRCGIEWTKLNLFGPFLKPWNVYKDIYHRISLWGIFLISHPKSELQVQDSASSYRLKLLWTLLRGSSFIRDNKSQGPNSTQIGDFRFAVDQCKGKQRFGQFGSKSNMSRRVSGAKFLWGESGNRGSCEILLMWN